MIARVRLPPRVITILDVIADANLLGSHFKDSATWAAWRAFLATLFGLPLSDEQRALFQKCTGRETPPKAASTEAWLVIGRRGGKSFVLALIAVFLACFRDWRPYLGPGEHATVMVIAADRKQARVILRYVKGLLRGCEMLARKLTNDRQEMVTLDHRTTIEVHAASFRSTRGYTIVAALCDEIAFWPTDDSAEPDYEILNAIRPGMATIPGAMLLCASSPYARRGALWDAHRKHYGKDGDPILVWQAATRVMNPSVPQSVIDEAMDRDPASASAEYLAQFRSDVESFVPREVVEACVDEDVFERAPVPMATYCAFVDPSGGSRDSMTLAIAHKDADIVRLDCVRERKPPFSPESVVQEFAAVLKSYRVTKVIGDRYAGEWPREQFSKLGITYEAAAKPKSDLYRELLPALNSKQVALLDHERLISQLVGLERRTARGGRDSVDHAPNAHDDVANCVAGVVASLALSSSYDASLKWVGDTDRNDAWLAIMRAQHLMRFGYRY